jgi:hypothetical protein
MPMAVYQLPSPQKRRREKDGRAGALCSRGLLGAHQTSAYTRNLGNRPARAHRKPFPTASRAGRCASPRTPHRDVSQCQDCDQRGQGSGRAEVDGGVPADLRLGHYHLESPRPRAVGWRAVGRPAELVSQGRDHGPTGPAHERACAFFPRGPRLPGAGTAPARPLLPGARAWTWVDARSLACLGHCPYRVIAKGHGDDCEPEQTAPFEIGCVACNRRHCCSFSQECGWTPCSLLLSKERIKL